MLLLTAPLVVIVLGGGLVSLVMGTVPKGGRYSSVAIVVYGLVIAWPNLQIVRGRATPAHLILALLLGAPNNWFDAWLTGRRTTWTSTLIPVVVAAAVAVDLAWRLHRRTHPKATTHQWRTTAAISAPSSGLTPDPGTLEALQAQLRTAGTDRVSLWVPDQLIYAGAPIPVRPSGLAAALLLDTALDVGLQPDGTTPGTGGAIFHYRQPHVPASERNRGHRA